MQFRLTYEGTLFASQGEKINSQKDSRVDHKHDIRQKFHDQLKRLWDITPHLRTGSRSGPSALVMQQSPVAPPRDVASMSARYSHYGWNFVPLVTSDLGLMCSLDILFLRPDPPGSVLQSGDIDNRLKTLFDALQIPDANQNYQQRTCVPENRPFFCLMENDRLITKVSVETDQLLQFVTSKQDINEVRLVITVTLRPYELRLDNMQFG